jgi:hypothetical protein
MGSIAVTSRRTDGLRSDRLAQLGEARESPPTLRMPRRRLTDFPGNTRSQRLF